MASCFRQRTFAAAALGSSVTLPVAGLAGDMMIAVLYAEEVGNPGFQNEAGWTKLTDLSVGEGFGAFSVWSVFSRQATSGEPASYTFQSGAGSNTVSTAGMMFAFFDDGGQTVTVDGAVVTAAGGTNSDLGFNAPPITPTGSADPFELVLALWWSSQGPVPTQLGSILACGFGGGPGAIAAQAYPLARGATASPFAAESTSFGFNIWMAFQLALMVSAPSTQRIMLRGVGQAASATIPLATNTLSGDLMVAFARGTNPITTPAGWSLIGPAQDGGRYGAYRKVAAGEPASYTFTNAIDGSITSWFHLDGTSLLVDIQSLSGPSGPVPSYLGPTLTTAFNNEIVICDWSDGNSSTAGITGPTGVLDAGDVWNAISGALTVDTAELISYFLQVTAGLTSGRTASRAANAIWYAAQVAIGVGGGSGGLGGGTLLTFPQC